MGPHTSVRIAMAITAAAMIWFGIGLAAYALLTALTEPVGLAWAAAITAAVLLVGPVGWMVVTSLRNPTPAAKPNGYAKTGNPILAALAATAEEKPLLAVLGAGLFGVAEALKNGHDKRL